MTPQAGWKPHLAVVTVLLATLVAVIAPRATEANDDESDLVEIPFTIRRFDFTPFTDPLRPSDGPLVPVQWAVEFADVPNASSYEIRVTHNVYGGPLGGEVIRTETLTYNHFPGPGHPDAMDSRPRGGTVEVVVAPAGVHWFGIRAGDYVSIAKAVELFELFFAGAQVFAQVEGRPCDLLTSITAPTDDVPVGEELEVQTRIQANLSDGNGSVTNIDWTALELSPAGLVEVVSGPTPSGIPSDFALESGDGFERSYVLRVIAPGTLTLSSSASGTCPSGDSVTALPESRQVRLTTDVLDVKVELEPAVVELEKDENATPIPQDVLATVSITNIHDEPLDAVRLIDLRARPREFPPPLPLPLVTVGGPFSPVGPEPDPSMLGTLIPGQTVVRTYDLRAQAQGEVDVTAFASATSPFGPGRITSSGTTAIEIKGDRIAGSVKRRGGDDPVEGITLTLEGRDLEGKDVSDTTTSDAQGAYAFSGLAPGVYVVSASGDPEEENGGTLSAADDVGGRCPGGAADNACNLVEIPSGPVDFVYTPCSAPERHPNGKPPTNCPIVFVPGFLGTRMECDGAELWPGVAPLSGEFEAEFGYLTLRPDGFTNDGAPGSCAANVTAVPGRGGIVGKVGGAIDIYQSAIDFLDSIARDRWSAYTYDWRRAVPVSVPGLDAAIDALLDDTGASRVVLMAHSMGGLVSRAYIGNAGFADKVSRFVTLGTPYWGAPKTHFALLTGDSDQPGSDVGDLDVLVATADLQRFARNAFGAFWLYPSANFGPWLSLEDVEQDVAGVNAWVAALGGTPALLDAARAGHAQIDGFVTNDIDYAVVVGVGLPTVTRINIRSYTTPIGGNVVSDAQWADLTYGSGDSTVPARSATQGAWDTGAPLGEQVPIHYACHVGHVALPGDAGVDARIRDFLVRGDPIEGLDDKNCGYLGVQVRSFVVDVLLEDANAKVLVPPRPTEARGAGETPSTLSVRDAVARGLVDIVTVGDRTTVVLDANRGMTLELGGHQGLQVQTISSAGDGPWRSYAGGAGPLTIGSDGAVTRDGKPAKELKLKKKKKAPRTKARIRKQGEAYLVRLRARSPNGVATTYYQIGDRGVVRYTQPFQVSKAELAELTYASSDVFGKMERWRRARRR